MSTTEPTKPAAELLREAAAADPEGHKASLARGYGCGPSLDERLQRIDRLDLDLIDSLAARRGDGGLLMRDTIPALTAELRDARAENDRLRSIVGGYGQLESDLGVTLPDALNAVQHFAHERDELRAELGDLRAKLAVVEALLPNTDEQFPIFPHQLRAALGAEVGDYILIPRAALSSAGGEYDKLGALAVELLDRAERAETKLAAVQELCDESDLPVSVPVLRAALAATEQSEESR